MKRLGPFRPLETTWEDWVLGPGLEGAFEDPLLPLQVEIGPGEDDFLIDSARAHPDTNWLGIEYSRKRIARYVRRIEREHGVPSNLRFVWRPAGDVIGPFLTPERVEAYHIYFPDPWPKAHHARYRLLTPAFIVALRESLVPGGHVYIATDAVAYAVEIVETFAAVRGFENELPDPGYTPLPPIGRATVFEERWRAMGREILSLRFRRAERA